MTIGRDPDGRDPGDDAATAPFPNPSSLQELFEHYVEQHVLHGTAPSPEQLCRDQPHLLEPLQEHIRDYRRLSQQLSVPGELKVGTELLHYRVVEKLGEGGMGQVYIAEDSKLGRRVALKVLSQEMAEHPERLARFRREARAVAGLNHPNIITVHSVDEHDGIHFLTMELVDGATLSRRIPKDGMSLERFFAVAVAVADALAAAHEQGITHRDLKPDNIMVDSRKNVKVLDFGLAKRSPGQATGLDSLETTASLTEEGRILGTMPYMSPEQLMAGQVDARSDIFSLGIMLYEMATGERPFTSHNPALLISSILRDQPEPITERRGELPRHLARIVRRCLEKEPERRYQSALEVRNELQDLWREVDSGEALTASAVARAMTTSPEAARRRRWSPAASALTAGLVAIVALYFSRGPSTNGPSPAASAASETSAPVSPSISSTSSMAVLYFQNLNNDPELDWLSSGLTDLLVIELSQSPEIDVLSTSRLYQILKEMNALDAPVQSFDVIHEIAERAEVRSVLRGGYTRAGDVLRIAYTVEDATDGEILVSNHLDGRGEKSLFTLVNQIAAAVRNNFAVSPAPEAPATVQAVTTSSLDAWRYYSQATVMHRQSKREEAIEALEKAVAVDPTFALAYANLARLHRSLGNVARAREITQRAVELAERLPVNRRHTIEGVYYAGRWATLGLAIDSFQNALRLYPERTAPRNNLAAVYTHLERYDEAIREYQILIDRGSSFPGNYTAIANAYAGLGRFDTGYGILQDFAELHPDNWFTQFWLGWLLTESGELDAALERFDRAEQLRPRELFIHYGRWRTRVLRQDWVQAEREAEALLTFEGSFARWRGAVSLARILAFQGRSQEALGRLDEAGRAYSEVSAFTALTHCWKAELRLERGELAEALVESESARELGREEWPELQSYFLAALAYQLLGRSADAHRMEEILRERLERNPNLVEERQVQHLAGRLALLRGETAVAVQALKRAEALLPPQGVESHWHVYPAHVPIWYALGRAELAAGRSEVARGWFEKAVSSGAEHLESPLPYVQSLYFLGRIHRTDGEVAEARQYYGRFIDLWQQGDLARPWLVEALEAVAN